MFRLRKSSFQYHHKFERIHAWAEQFTVMTERYIISVNDIERLRSQAPDGELDFKQISYLDRVLVEVNKDSLESTSSFIQQNFGACTFYVNATTVEVDDALDLLNVGAVKVFVTYAQFKHILEQRLLQDVTRLIIELDRDAEAKEGPAALLRSMHDELEKLAAPVKWWQAGVQVHDAYDLEPVMEIMKGHPTQRFDPVYLPMDKMDSTDRWVQLRAEAGSTMNVVAIFPAKNITSEEDKAPWRIPAAALLLCSIKTDRTDGLFTTIVTNEHGVCLGLVYSSPESVAAALRTGRGVFKSRKRNGLWYKGETSGDVQELIRVGVDCDEDCVVFVVRQKGDGMLQRPSRVLN
jgi:phosphoribosyl-ATP pyrophosphohydrolase/phosphoribosyl-AMP cyclohydrolase/histidinol dehydrogenase